MSEYREFLKNSLKKYYNIKENISIGNFSFDILAEFNQENSKYFLLKELKYYSFNQYEYLFYKKIKNNFSLKNYKKFIKDNLLEIISLEKDHMSSTITLIFETTSPLDKKIIKKIQKFKFYKSFQFGLKGWVNVKLIVINSNKNIGYSNKLGKKELPKFLLTNK